MIGIQGKENILTKEECQSIIKYLDKVEEENLWTYSPDPRWQNRFIEAFHVEDEHVQNITRKVYFELKNIMPEGQEADTIHLVKWRDGVSQDIHVDSIFEWREFSSIVYLNDDFDGGLTHFPNQEVSVTPRTGLVIAFEGNENYPHLVSEVRNGVRYTIASFWTSNSDYQYYKGWCS